jgi:hypothetical protein
MDGDPDLGAYMGQSFGCQESWPKFGCGAKFRPWAKGEAMVAEFRTETGEWKAFLCALMPEIVDDEIKKVQVSWTRAIESMTSDEIFDVVPITYPVCHSVSHNGTKVHGVSRFPVAKWIADGSPVMDTSGWLKLAMRVASKDIANLGDMFTACEQQFRAAL